MADMRVKVTIPSLDGLPEDAITNTWHFAAFPGVEGNAPIAVARLVGFYSDIASMINVSAASPAVEFDVYDLADPSPRVPVFSTSVPIAWSGASGGAPPTECCLCLSFHGLFESGEPNARRRGRVFISPLDNNTGDDTLGGPRVSAATVTDLADAGEALNAANTVTLLWSVWSQADGVMHPVVGGWVDNAYDTQRRRGLDATSRTIWTAVP